MGIEQRKHPRVVLRQNVIINYALRAMGLDLSEGGIYVHTGRSFAEGTIVTVQIPMGVKPVTFRARVQHAKEGVGMGLAFVNPPPAHVQSLNKFIFSLAGQRSKEGKKTVLLIDPADMSRRMCASKLTFEGFTVQEAKNGAEGLDALKSGETGLVVTELYMPGLDGFKFLVMMRSEQAYESIPVLVISNRSSAEDIDKAMEAGATEFLVRSFTSPAKLCDRVKQHLLGG